MQQEYTVQHHNSTAIAITGTGNAIKAATQRAIALLGGMRTILHGATVALLKPNFVAGRSALTGATTSFAILQAVAEEVHACGAEPVLFEIPGMEFDREATYQLLNVPAFCAQHGIRILRLDPEGHGNEWAEILPLGAHTLHRFRIPRLLLDPKTRLINLPVLKTHVVSTMSLSIKNLMGLLPRPDRRTMHTLGLDRCLVDLYRGLQPALTIVDGSVGQHGEGPLYGEVANLQTLVAGRHCLAVDLACCQLVDVQPQAVPHLRLALKTCGTPTYHLVGDPLTTKRSFRLPEQRRLYRSFFWLMHALDYPFSTLVSSEQHLCTTLYQTGLVGTRPTLLPKHCTRCGKCTEACPLPNVIDLNTLRINYTTCQRCLLCYDACPEQAITVKGFSGARL